MFYTASLSRRWVVVWDSEPALVYKRTCLSIGTSKKPRMIGIFNKKRGDEWNHYRILSDQQHRPVTEGSRFDVWFRGRRKSERHPIDYPFRVIYFNPTHNERQIMSPQKKTWMIAAYVDQSLLRHLKQRTWNGFKHAWNRFCSLVSLHPAGRKFVPLQGFTLTLNTLRILIQNLV